MKITVSGAVGSGKSTVSKILAGNLGYSYYSIGGLMREMAKDMGTSLQELTKRAETDAEIDKELDLRQKAIGKMNNFVMDSRLGFYFIPDSFKIYIEVELDEAARRIYKEKRSGEKYKSLQEAIEMLKKRMNSEKIRYKKYYKIEFPQKADFDLVIDSTNKKPHEIIEEILSRLKTQ